MNQRGCSKQMAGKHQTISPRISLKFGIRGRFRYAPSTNKIIVGITYLMKMKVKSANLPIKMDVAINAFAKEISKVLMGRAEAVVMILLKTGNSVMGKSGVI